MKPPSETNPPWVSLSLAERIDAVCVEFEKRWQEDQAPRLERFLEGVADRERGPLLRELLRLEVEYRIRKGERPGVEEYVRRFPGHAAEVREVVEMDLPDSARPPSEPTVLAPAGPAPQGAATMVTPLTIRFDRRLHEDPVPLRDRRADLPEKLAAVIHRALERQPGRRFSDVTQFWKALRPFA